MQTTLDHRTLYRLPWSFSDNSIAWLEPTAKCNLSCQGCYRANLDEHKTLAEVRKDLETFKRFRKFDGVSIAGGDVLADGRQNMCDGCPDITVHEGELVWSCRLEERLEYGSFLRTVPKSAATRS